MQIHSSSRDFHTEKLTKTKTEIRSIYWSKGQKDYTFRLDERKKNYWLNFYLAILFIFLQQCTVSSLLFFSVQSDFS